MKRSSVVIRYILLAVAAFGALEWALSYRLGALVSVAGWLLMIPAVSAFIVAIFTRWWPTAGLVGFGRAASIVGIAIWAVSAIADLKVHPTASEEWHFGFGELSYTRYRTSSPRFPSAPDYDVRLKPAACPFGLSYLGMGYLRGGSSRTVGVGTWLLAACTGFPTLVLSQLRRTRLPVNAYHSCGYDLTGNVSGRCPECGEPAVTKP